MVNEEKVKIMTKLAMYEKKEGKKSLAVSRYYRSDYIGLALIKNFFLVTIGYGLLLLVLAVYFSDYLMDNIHKMDLIVFAEYLVGGYVVFLVAYSVLTYIIYFVKYSLAKRKVRKYYEELTKLNKIYGRDEMKAEKRTSSGGRKK